jgi:hypothetical protein
LERKWTPSNKIDEGVGEHEAQESRKSKPDRV